MSERKLIYRNEYVEKTYLLLDALEEGLIQGAGISGEIWRYRRGRRWRRCCSRRWVLLQGRERPYPSRNHGGRWLLKTYVFLLSINERED